MKVILLRDIPKIGKKYEIKDVPDGYAINLLIPQKMVEAATPRKIKEIEELNNKMKSQKEAEILAIRSGLAKLAGLELIIKAKANSAGHLFQSITRRDIAEKMRKDYGIEIPEASISLDRPIKEAGQREIAVNIGSERASFALVIEGQT